MRSLILRSTAAIGLLLLLAGSAPAHEAECRATVPYTIQNIEAAETEGLITPDEAALNKIYHIFDPEKVDARFLVEDDVPGRCATPIIASILASDLLSDAVKETLQGYIHAPPPIGDRVLYISPSGIFRLNYLTSGPNAVPLADDDSSGVPDFVEWCAGYLDYSWQREIDELGFVPPVIIPGTDYYISFENMGYYGYTTPLGSGRTRITLHRNFLSFPANDDPDGDQKGAAKVTCAHEFKHASQYAGSNWWEGTEWIELDATSLEEVVYPQTNDYKWYINSSGSPLRSPEQPLDYLTMGGYEDAIWQLYMAGIFGVQILPDIWNHRANNPPGPMTGTFDTILQDYGSSLEETWGLWTRWNYLTGWRTWDGYGYADSDIFFACATVANTSGLPASPINTTVSHLACRYGRHYALSGLEGSPKVIVDGESGIAFHPQVIVWKLDDTVDFYEVALDANNDGELVIATPYSAIDEIGVTLPNGDTTGNNRTISYDLDTATTGVDEIPGFDMKLHPNYPNPFNPKTTIRFELAAASQVELSVATPSGRVVRHLLRGEVYEGGEHQLVFDGKDDAGGDLPSGVYFAMLNLGGSHSQLAKMTLLK